MFRAFTSVVLFLVLVGGKPATTPASYCPSSIDNQRVHYAAAHCRTALHTATPMSCCRHVLVTHPEEIAKASPVCCQMSAPFPVESSSALTAYPAEQFRLHTQAQWLESAARLPSSAMGFAWAWSIAFCPDRSDTYLRASTFRI
jgi:hypothetical protein